MSHSKKHKSDYYNGSSDRRKRRLEKYILHVSGIQHSDFTPISEAKVPATDKLAQLHLICERRLREPYHSDYRMEDV